MNPLATCALCEKTFEIVNANLMFKKTVYCSLECKEAQEYQRDNAPLCGNWK
jgi:hypothetical protein